VHASCGACGSAMSGEPPSKRARGDEFYMLTLRQCHGLLKPLLKMSDAHYFTTPVDWKALNIPDYPLIVRDPMDLGTVQKRLDSGKYLSVDDFVREVRLVFHNCRIYNPAHMPVGIAGARISDAFEANLAQLKDTAGSAAAAHKSGGASRSGAPAAVGAEAEAAPPAAAEYGMPMKNAKAILKSLQNHGHSFQFRLPVDPVRLGLPTYLDIIKQPMDLSTVQRKLGDGEYATVGDVRARRPKPPRPHPRRARARAAHAPSPGPAVARACAPPTRAGTRTAHIRRRRISDRRARCSRARPRLGPHGVRTASIRASPHHTTCRSRALLAAAPRHRSHLGQRRDVQHGRVGRRPAGHDAARLHEQKVLTGGAA
jgi:hypothetical protein